MSLSHREYRVRRRAVIVVSGVAPIVGGALGLGIDALGASTGVMVSAAVLVTVALAFAYAFPRGPRHMTLAASYTLAFALLEWPFLFLFGLLLVHGSSD